MLRLHGSAGQLTLRLRRRALSRPLLQAFAIAIALHLGTYLLVDLRTPCLAYPTPRPPAFVSADLGVTIQATGTEAAPVVGPSGLLPRHIPTPDVPYPELPSLPSNSLSNHLPQPATTRPSFSSAEMVVDLPSRTLFAKTYIPITLEFSHELAHLEILGSPTPETHTAMNSLERHLIRYNLAIDPRRGKIIRAQPLDAIPNDLALQLHELIAALHFSPTNTLEPVLCGIMEVHITR